MQCITNNGIPCLQTWEDVKKYLRLIYTAAMLKKIKGDITMANIFKWFAGASDKWDHTGHNDAKEVLNLIGGIFGALGF